ncbi:Ca-activated chloride channel family protein [Laceyella sediminis]|uniref:Ca-activated chloride channel family protein n=1 Tax=Laceyella sediminis TaxID=573074 RepID=A0ABX5EKL8_9BACL|nr:VWA domain-containing protein [Laceyella sediminis]PRZ12385.1 Ca-activated chloride channel family protein [Laceyella sediminis]
MNSFYVKVVSGLVVFSVAIAGCSTPVSKTEEGVTAEQNKETKKAYATEVEEMLKEGPGKYAGDAYHKENANKELDTLPKNLTGEQVYQKLVELFAEDYQPYVKKLDAFDTTYTIGGDPGDLKTLSGKQLNVMILIDSSGSMAGKVDGFSKMTLAKQAVSRFASSLSTHANVSLRVYGHKGSNADKDKDISCKSTEVVYPLGKYDQQRFNKALDAFKPTGWTPIALAMKEAANDLAKINGPSENLVYVVSDGIETCGGNPVQVAQELNKSNVKAVVNIIGFDVDNAGQKALQEVAKAGGGEYATVRNDEGLRRYFDTQRMKIWDQWLMWKVRNTSNIIQQFTRKERELQRLTFGGLGIDKLSMTESHRMRVAVSHLQSRDKLSIEEADKVRELINNREDKIDKYRKSRYDSLIKLLKENKEKIEKLVEKKGENKMDEYDTN